MNLLNALRPLMLATTLIASVASAQEQTRVEPVQDNSASAAAMGFDLLIVRPLSLVATFLGSGLFVLQLPLNLLQGESPYDAAHKLVVEPAEYTFSRPLGQMD